MNCVGAGPGAGAASASGASSPLPRLRYLRSLPPAGAFSGFAGAAVGRAGAAGAACAFAAALFARLRPCTAPLSFSSTSFVIFASRSFETPRSVSNTPAPFAACASNQGTFRRFSSRFMSSTGIAFGRSRLLSWITSGMIRMSIPYAFRFNSRFVKLSRFSAILSGAESATKTTASTPLSTSFRVAL